jgi:HK97 family phage major capsid protein
MPTPLHEQKDLLQERAKIFERMKEVRQKAEADNRDLTAEEQGHWDQGMKDMDSLKQRADRQATEAATEKELNSVVRSIARPEVGDRATASFTSTAEYRKPSITCFVPAANPRWSSSAP